MAKTPRATYVLRVTRRALDDMKLDPEEGPTFDIEANVRTHDVLRAFWNKRRNSPVGQEQTQGIKAPVYNLHAKNPWRAVTWHDEDEGVVWLLAVSPHNYDLFVQRAANNELKPTVQDYADLAVARSVLPTAMDEGETLEMIAAEGLELVEAAFASPNTEVSGVLVASVDVALYVEVLVDLSEGGDVYLGFKLPPRTGKAVLPEPLIQVCVALMLPDADDEHLDWRLDQFPGRKPEAGEWVVRWRRPSE